MCEQTMVESQQSQDEEEDAFSDESASAATERSEPDEPSEPDSLEPARRPRKAVGRVTLRDAALLALPSHLTHTCVRTLDVSDNRLSALPRLPRLRTLRAARNQIGTIQEAMSEGCSLRSVDLSHNRLRAIVSLGPGYQRLEVLDVSHNAVEQLQLGAVCGLRELRAQHNRMRTLQVHGAKLRTLIASHNELESLEVEAAPTQLEELDVSRTRLAALPQWLSSCAALRDLRAERCQLTALPEHLLCSEVCSLARLHLAHNRLARLPALPRLRAPLTHLLLHDNRLAALPDNLFTACDRLQVLSLTRNRLTRLPPAGPAPALRRIYLSHNRLTDTALDVLSAFRGLRVLHVAHNRLTILSERCTRSWPELEELVVSGNRLAQLPDVLPTLPRLRVVRVHSNCLRAVPMFAGSASVRILDFAHNELDDVDLRLLAPQQLKFLDISGNRNLRIGPSHFKEYRSQRPLSLVDVTGRGSPPRPPPDPGEWASVWRAGFSECPDRSMRLSCAQIRLPTFCNREGFFAIIDGETDPEGPKILQSCLPGLLLEERSIKETSNEYMKYVVLSAHRELKERGQRKGACLIMCHMTPMNPQENGFDPTAKRYNLRLANVGDTKAVLSRRNGPLSLGLENDKRLGRSAEYPASIPDPDVIQTVIKDDDEFLILGNGKFWEAVDVDAAVAEVREESEPALAAKRLQDLALGYGAEDCLSVIVVKLDGARDQSDDRLMRELQRTIDARGEADEHSERSSPSGQSERAPSAGSQHYARAPQPGRFSVRGVARAVRARVEEERAADPPDSDEQFRCWEYMLEQNSQLIFDKELDSLSKGIRSEAGSLRALRPLSGSSPQLHAAGGGRPRVPFLSKRFGSARGTGARGDQGWRLAGGPHAAYFGSLQRLLPDTCGYDYAVTRERSHPRAAAAAAPSPRLHSYWGGVATTEL